MRREEGVTPDAARRVRAAAVLALPALAALLWVARAWHAGPDLWFLPWNLFLAAVPWAAASWATSARSRVVALAAGGLWLLFLPNAPYLVTDLVHLRDRAEVPHGFDVLLFSTFGLAGCVLGWASMETVHRRLAGALGRRWAAAIIAGVVLLAGVGVYLGRYERWNSWDALTQPGAVLADLVGALASPRALAFALLFAAYLGAGYGFFLARDLFPGGSPLRGQPTGDLAVGLLDRAPLPFDHHVAGRARRGARRARPAAGQRADHRAGDREHEPDREEDGRGGEREREEPAHREEREEDRQAALDADDAHGGHGP